MEAIIYTIFGLLDRPLKDTYTNYNNAKKNNIHDGIDITRVLDFYLVDDASLVTQEQIKLLSSMLQFSPDDRMSSYDDKIKPCPRLKEGLKKGSLHNMDLKLFYDNVLIMIKISKDNDLQYNTCYAAICLMERYAANFNVTNASLLAASCLMLMAEFYEYEYLTEQSFNKDFNVKFTLPLLNRMQLKIMKDANYVISYCDMDPVLHSMAEVDQMGFNPLDSLRLVITKLRDKNIYMGDLSSEDIAKMF
jgi:hypothetical protein